MPNPPGRQQIRDAVGEPGLTEPEFLAPVLATFVWALPRSFGGVPAAPGTTVALEIPGPAGGAWHVARQPGGWALYEGAPDDAAARVRLDADRAWRLFTKGIGPHAARQAATVSGDPALADRVLATVAIIG